MKIISGGQTGVDRAALDVAICLNIPHGGWCPRGRKAEDGVIDKRYQLLETLSDDYSERTKANINDASGTLIIVPSLPLTVNDGTVLTINYVQEIKKPYYLLSLENAHEHAQPFSNWLSEKNIIILNVAGPRESQAPGVYAEACQFLKTLFSARNN